LIGGFPMAKKNNKYVIAVKDFENSAKVITEGKKLMPKEVSAYKDIFDGVIASCSDLEGLKKFIKKTKFSKKDCSHYWEGLITLGFTLLLFEYDTEDENFVENACDNEIVKFISKIF
jgi:hypothetical protein